MITKRPLGAWLLFVAIVVTMGSNYVLIKLTVETIPPLTMAAGRAFLALLVLAMLMGVNHYTFPPLMIVDEASGTRRLSRVWRYLLLLSVFGLALPFFLISWAQQYIDASLSAILLAFMPLTTVALVPFFVSSENWTLTRTMGFLFGFVGVAVLFGVGALRGLGGSAHEIMGQLAALGAAFCYGVGAVFLQRLGPINPVTAATIQNGTAVCLLAPFSLVVDVPWTLSPSVTSLIALAMTGVIATGFGSVGFFILVRLGGATFMALTNYASPLWAVVVAMIVLDERPGANAYVALIFILTGLALTQFRPGALSEFVARRVRP